MHTPSTASDTGKPASDNTSDNNANGGTGQTGQTSQNPTSGHGNSPKKTVKDLASAVAACQTDNYGTQRSLQAKIDSVTRANGSAKAEHHLAMLSHKLDTPSVEKHASACLNSLKAIISELAANPYPP